jgi:hypothetical protein
MTENIEVKTAPIYTGNAAVNNVLALKDVDYYERPDLSMKGPETDVDDLVDGDVPEGGEEEHDEILDKIQREEDGFVPGQYFGDWLNLQVLPEGANVGLQINTKRLDYYADLVEFPNDLSMCIFSRAPGLPDKYAEIMAFWSRPAWTPSDTGAKYYQNESHSYMVNLDSDDCDDEDVIENEDGTVTVLEDQLLSESIVVHIKELGRLIGEHNLDPEQFIEIGIPIDPDVLSEDGSPNFLTYNKQSDRFDRIFLQVKDVMASPDPENIYIDLLRHEMLDYGYYY